MGARRQEAQEVDLLADLRDQREHHRRGGAEQHEVRRKPVLAGPPAVMGPARERTGIKDRNGGKRQDVKDDPDRLGPQLQPADESDAMGNQRNDHHRAEHVA